jgi:hypothetical protein
MSDLPDAPEDLSALLALMTLCFPTPREDALADVWQTAQPIEPAV